MFVSSFISTAHAGIITEAPRVSEVLLNVLNSLLGFVGMLAIMVFVAMGTRYFFAGGDERSVEIAKKWMQYAAIGIAVALGAMIILSTISGWLA